MRRRRSNFAIGAATLTVIAVTLVALLGYRKIHGLQSRGPMRIVFEGGSASGLLKGGAVNFDGIPAARRA